jgi:hypothetical protein
MHSRTSCKSGFRWSSTGNRYACGVNRDATRLPGVTRWGFRFLFRRCLVRGFRGGFYFGLALRNGFAFYELRKVGTCVACAVDMLESCVEEFGVAEESEVVR